MSCDRNCDVLARYMAFVRAQARTEYDAIGTVVEEKTIGLIGPGPVKVVHLPIYACLGLAGETGEFVELMKKWARDPFHARPDQEKVKSELGDIIWYVTRIGQQLGLTLEEIIAYNVEKLDRRNKIGKENEKP